MAFSFVARFQDVTADVSRFSESIELGDHTQARSVPKVAGRPAAVLPMHDVPVAEVLGQVTPGRPVWTIQKIASEVRRWSRGGRLRKAQVSMTNGAKKDIPCRSGTLEPKLSSLAKVSVESRRTAWAESPCSALLTRPRAVADRLSGRLQKLQSGTKGTGTKNRPPTVFSALLSLCIAKARNAMSNWPATVCRQNHQSI